MFSSFFANKKWAAWAYFGLAVLLISTYAQVQMIVLLNNWYKDFYLAKRQRSHDRGFLDLRA